MKEVVLQWIGVISLLVFVYLVVSNGSQASQVIASLSGANTGAIKALQGR